MNILPKNSKDLEGVRTFLNTIKTLCSTAEIYEAPVKSLFDDLAAKLETALGALPKVVTPGWSLNDNGEHIFSLLGCANNVASALGQELSKTKTQLASLVTPDAAVADALLAGTVVQHSASNNSELTSEATFGRQIGRTPVTIWRWRKLGWLDPSVNIAGKPYLTRESIEKFNRRAKAGEFARAPHAPRRKKGQVGK
jgi:hypothetical protein